MCAYIAIIATILQVKLWCVNNALSLKCHDYELEAWLAGCLEYTVGGPWEGARVQWRKDPWEEVTV